MVLMRSSLFTRLTIALAVAATAFYRFVDWVVEVLASPAPLLERSTVQSGSNEPLRSVAPRIRPRIHPAVHPPEPAFA